MIDLKAHIRTVPDYPKPGILFYDIGTLLAHGPAWHETIESLVNIIEPLKPDCLIGIEARGFLVGAAIAARMGIGFAMVRKKGKLPGRVLSQAYALEYGQDMIEMQEGIIKTGSRAVLVDDLLATGGTATAAITLAEQLAIKIIHAVFVVELDFLNGRTRLNVPVTSLLHYAE